MRRTQPKPYERSIRDIPAAALDRAAIAAMFMLGAYYKDDALMSKYWSIAKNRGYLGKKRNSPKIRKSGSRALRSKD